MWMKAIKCSVTTQHQADCINYTLKKLGIYVNEVKVMKGAKEEDWDQAPKFTGMEALKVIENFKIFLEFVYEEHSEKKLLAVETINSFLNFWNILSSKISDINSLEEKQTKAIRVRDAAINWVISFKKMACDSAVTYYMHVATKHLYDMILECPIDIMDCSGTAIEHSNKDLKNQLKLTNKSKTSKKTKFLQIATSLIARKRCRRMYTWKKRSQKMTKPEKKKRLILSVESFNSNFVADVKSLCSELSQK